jgi:cysteinyl-tRNA synthetase
MALAEPEDDPRKLEIADEVDALLLARTKARSDKDWAKADEIRDTLQQMGVVVTDTADGPTWDLA